MVAAATVAGWECTLEAGAAGEVDRSEMRQGGRLCRGWRGTGAGEKEAGSRTTPRILARTND